MRLRNSVLAEVLLIALVYGVGVLFNWRRNAAMDLPTWYGMTVTGNCNRADAEVEGHHVQFVRGSVFGHLRCGDRPVVSGATARQDEREPARAIRRANDSAFTVCSSLPRRGVPATNRLWAEYDHPRISPGKVCRRYNSCWQFRR